MTSLRELSAWSWVVLLLEDVEEGANAAAEEHAARMRTAEKRMVKVDDDTNGLYRIVRDIQTGDDSDKRKFLECY
jgi:hypothetical protein